MKYEIVDNNLVFTAEGKDDIESLQDMLDRSTNKDTGFLCQLLEDWQANGHLYPVEPEWITALTEAPIISDEVVFEDDGRVVVKGNVWWFPNYCIESFAETLIKTGTVTFVAAPKW